MHNSKHNNFNIIIIICRIIIIIMIGIITCIILGTLP